MERYFKRKSTEDNISPSTTDIPESSNENNTESILANLPGDPGLRLRISEYDPNIRDQVRRAYLQRELVQPRTHQFPYTSFAGVQRRFNPKWFDDFPTWLEYSISKNAVFCRSCYLFKLKIPDQAASVLLKGMTAQVLLRQSFKVKPGHTVLVHAAAGGVGSLLCQWANALGATVIGTVSTNEKTAQAKDDGCHHVIVYTEEDFVARVTEITSDNGVDVVYDSVGNDAFQGSLACLKTRGYMVSFGQASGVIDPVPLSALAAKSLFLTRPALFQYTAAQDKLLEVAGEVFANVASGVLCVRVNHKYPLSHAAQAHADLENRKTSGSAVLIP